MRVLNLLLRERPARLDGRCDALNHTEKPPCSGSARASGVEFLYWRYDVSASNLLQCVVFVIVVAVLVKPLGGYMALVFRGEKTLLDPVLRPVRSSRCTG